MYHPEENRPGQPKVVPNVLEEIRAVNLFHDITLIYSVIDPLRTSKWKILVQTVACVYRFISNCRRKMSKKKIEVIPATKKVVNLVLKQLNTTKLTLTREEFRKAESYSWNSAQTDAFAQEMKILLKNQQLPVDKWFSLEKDSTL